MNLDRFDTRSIATDASEPSEQVQDLENLEDLYRTMRDDLAEQNKLARSDRLAEEIDWISDRIGVLRKEIAAAS